MGSYYLLLIVISGASMWVSGTLKRKFKKYSNIQLRSNMSGKEIAEKMLADHGIKDVKIISVRGSLTDHYNPQKKTINLSESVFN
jgi:Zn-dependent membrane protease YugP